MLLFFIYYMLTDFKEIIAILARNLLNILSSAEKGPGQVQWSCEDPSLPNFADSGGSI